MKRRSGHRLTLLGLGAALVLAPSSLAGELEGRVVETIAPQRSGREAVPAPVPRGLKDPWLFEAGNRVELDPPDVVRLVAEDRARPRPLRSGVRLDVEISPATHGLWTRLDDGGWLWTMVFAARCAASLNLRFEPLLLPNGAQLLVYGVAGLEKGDLPEVVRAKRGPVRRDQYMTADIYDDEIRVEYALSPGLHPAPASRDWLITGLYYGYRDLDGSVSASTDEVALDEAQACHLNAACYSDWSYERSGTVYIYYFTSTEKINGSGAMLNRVPEDLTPIIMTAEHNGITASNVETVRAVWGYEKDQCVNGTAPDPGTLPDSTGQVLLVNHHTSDFSLLGVEFNVPWDAGYLGYDATYFANSSTATGIHHPKGTFRRMSFGSKFDDATTGDGKSVYKVRWPSDNGLVEQGSSGSAILDSSHKVRGVLTVFYEPLSCDTFNDAGYGRMNVAWPELQPYLAPVDPVYVDVSWSGDEKGTADKPFGSFLKGAYAVAAGHHMYVKAGHYDEQFVIDKAMIVHATDGSVYLGAAGP
jgi:hypothetical protein